MELTLGVFGDKRLEKGGLFVRSACRLWGQGRQRPAWAAIAPARCGSRGFSQSQSDDVRDDGHGAGANLCAARTGHVLAIQDTSALRVDEKGLGLSFHPVIAVDAEAGTVLGLVDTSSCAQGRRESQTQETDFADKDSRRWLTALVPAALAEAGATCVTVIEDREGDIYDCFAFKPAKWRSWCGRRRTAVWPMERPSFQPRPTSGMKPAG